MSLKRFLIGMFLLLASSSSLMGRDIDQVIQALAPYVGGAQRPFYELQSTSLHDGILTAEVSWTRRDRGRYAAILEISNGELKAVQELSASPAVDSAEAARLLPLLQAMTPGPLVITGFVRASHDRVLVAYQQDLGAEETPQRYLAEVLSSRGRGEAQAYKPQYQDRKLLRELALVMAQFQAYTLAARYDAITAAARERGEEFPGPIGPVARLEVELRLAKITSRQMLEQTADESAVGFDPAHEWIQYMLPAVLSDNAVFVTFSKNGQYRLEDFN